MLVHLPNGHDAEQVAAELVAMMNTLPKVLKGSLTWDSPGQ
jgi:IS30 family transposase